MPIILSLSILAFLISYVSFKIGKISGRLQLMRAVDDYWNSRGMTQNQIEKYWEDILDYELKMSLYEKGCLDENNQKF